MSKAPVRCYIGLGSNLNHPVQQLQQALRALQGIAHSRLLSASSLYQSAPLGPQDQPDYINAVACLETSLEPEQLLDALQAIEQQQGRIRAGVERWGARTLDLDILLYGEQSILSERLNIPHPEIKNRSFVLLPLQEIADNLPLPDGGSVQECLQQLAAEPLQRIDSPLAMLQPD